MCSTQISSFVFHQSVQNVYVRLEEEKTGQEYLTQFQLSQIMTKHNKEQRLQFQSSENISYAESQIQRLFTLSSRLSRFWGTHADYIEW